jgi:hypothetical protein
MHKTYILVYTCMCSCCEATLPVDPSEGPALYRVEHENPASRLVDKRGPRSRTLYSKFKQMQMQSTYWLEKVLKMIFLYVNALLCTLQRV